jgi:predicted HAD superfamily phosphohydrolase YqeG
MKLLKRIFYSLHMGYAHRNALAKLYLRTPPQQSTLDIVPQDLLKQGVKILVLDFDGVLASHGELLPAPEIAHWLQSCLQVFPAAQIFLLSNKPLPARVAYFENYGIRCIAGVQKKPYPEGLLKIQQVAQCEASEILLVDDRLLTGGLAACIAQTQIYYVTRPLIALSKRPVAESFFMLVRWVERRIIAIYSVTAL